MTSAVSLRRDMKVRMREAHDFHLCIKNSSTRSIIIFSTCDCARTQVAHSLRAMEALTGLGPSRQSFHGKTIPLATKEVSQPIVVEKVSQRSALGFNMFNRCMIFSQLRLFVYVPQSLFSERSWNSSKKHMVSISRSVSINALCLATLGTKI